MRNNAEIWQCGQTLGCQGCLAVATKNHRSISRNSECRKVVKVQCVTTPAERLEVSKRQSGKVKWRQDRTRSWVRATAAVEQLRGTAKCPHREGHEERPKMKGRRVCKTLQRADLSSQHTVRCDWESRGCETVGVAEVFLPREN